MKPASAQESPSSDGEGEEGGGGRKEGRKEGRGGGGGEAAGRYEGEEAIFSKRANQTKNGETKICALFVLLTVKSSDRTSYV